MIPPKNSLMGVYGNPLDARSVTDAFEFRTRAFRSPFPNGSSLPTRNTSDALNTCG